jgi:hypothetical protein
LPKTCQNQVVVSIEPAKMAVKIKKPAIGTKSGNFVVENIFKEKP